MNDWKEGKYIETGSGQVYYLYYYENQKLWGLTVFVGGPEGVEPVQGWDTLEEAIAALKTMGLKPFDHRRVD